MLFGKPKLRARKVVNVRIGEISKEKINIIGRNFIFFYGMEGVNSIYANGDAFTVSFMKEVFGKIPETIPPLQIKLERLTLGRFWFDDEIRKECGNVLKPEEFVLTLFYLQQNRSQKSEIELSRFRSNVFYVEAAEGKEVAVSVKYEKKADAWILFAHEYKKNSKGWPERTFVFSPAADMLL